MSTREYLDEVIETLKKEYGVSQERAEKMIDDTYFAFKIEFNPYMYSDIALSDVAMLIVKTFSNPEVKYQRFYDRVVEYIIRDFEVSANTAIQVMSFNNSKEVFMNHKDTIDGMDMGDLKMLAEDFYDRYKAHKHCNYVEFFNGVRNIMVEDIGLNVDEAHDILRFYNLKLVHNNILLDGDKTVLENHKLFASSAIQYFVRNVVANSDN